MEILQVAPVSYPFVPKSTKGLIPGQFWAIPLSNGQYACGRVIAFCPQQDGQPHSRHFVAGLLDWYSDKAPTSEGIAGQPVLEQGMAHVKTIVHTGREIVGYRALENDGIELGLVLACVWRNTFWIQRDSVLLRQASADDEKRIPTLSGWGPDYIRARAEYKFLGRKTSN